MPSSAYASDSAVPSQFIGHWAGSPESCSSQGDDLVLRIEPTQISYWESHGLVLAAITREHNELALILDFSGEGEAWLGTALFKLSEDGQQLTDSTTVPGQEIVRYKCTVAAATG